MDLDPEKAVTAVSHSCDECGVSIEGADIASFGDAYIAHARSAHPDWPYSDVDIRNYAEATQRLTGPRDRLPAIGGQEIHPVTEDRIDDWLRFFDHDAFADNAAWASCYCLDPHLREPGAEPWSGLWRDNRETMVQFLRSGACFGYLAYVDETPAGWLNASRRSDYALFRLGARADPPDEAVLGIACFVIAPPYRRHGLAARLLDRAIDDAAARGFAWIEGYPAKGELEGDALNFRGPRSLFDSRGFQQVEERERYLVVRRRI